MATTEQKLEQAQADLARIQDQQETKVAAANAAFDADPTEQNAEAISAVERVATLMIGKAKAKVADLEKQLGAERRESLEAEAAQLRAVVDSGVVELEPLIDRGFEVQQLLEQHERDLQAFYNRIGSASQRASEIELELSGRVLNADQRHVFLMRTTIPLNNIRTCYESGLKTRAQERRNAELAAKRDPVEEKKKLQEEIKQERARQKEERARMKFFASSANDDDLIIE